MIHPLSNQVNWQQLIKMKQDKVNNTNERENRSRKELDYQVGQKILILNKTQLKEKLEPTVLNEGP